MRMFRRMTRKPLNSASRPLLLVVLAMALVACALVGCKEVKKPPADFQKATVEYVIDGDTVDVIVDGYEKRVRLASIDAPESALRDAQLNTEEGALATEYLRSLLPVGSAVYLQKDTSETDRYDRLVRYVWVDVPDDPYDDAEIAAKMANSLVVEAGFAKAERYWPDIAYLQQLQRAQERAIAASAGVSYLWAGE